MMSDFSPEFIVRLQLKNEPDAFVCLSSLSLDETKESILCRLQRVYGYCIDPLTSKMMAGLATFETNEVTSIENLGRLPIRLDYLIDCVASFGNFPMAFHSRPTLEWQTAREILDPAAAAQFISFVLQFLKRHSLVTDCLNETEIWRRNLNALGLDFMRQHYRSIKNVFLIDRQLPSIDVLEYLLRATTLNRTHDSDWGCTGAPG